MKIYLTIIIFSSLILLACSNQKTRGFEEPIYRFIINHENGSLKKYLENGGDPNFENEKGVTPVFVAIKVNNIGAIYLLAEHGANLNHLPDSGLTPLSSAVFSKSYESIEELLKLGADINYNIKSNLSAFIMAVLKRETELVKLFVLNGADLTTEWVKNNSRYSAYGTYKDLDHFEYLLSHGMPVDAYVNKDKTFPRSYFFIIDGMEEHLDLMVKYGWDVNKRYTDGATTLHFAVMQNSEKSVKKILSLNPNLDIKDLAGNTALDIARINGFADIEKLLKAKLSH